MMCVLRTMAAYGVPLVFAVAAARAQSPQAALTLHFERPGMSVPEFTLTVRGDETGTYAATYVAPPADSKYGSANVAAVEPATQTTRTFSISKETWEKLLERVRSADLFRGGCESKLKNIANTGAKTLTYDGPDGTGTCTYNFTENKMVAGITTTMQAIAQTMDDGRAIERLHRYDRLGLDHELQILVDEVHDGRAVEVGIIAPILQSLCNDTQVLERVRKRAAGLLEASGSLAARQ